MNNVRLKNYNSLDYFLSGASPYVDEYKFYTASNSLQTNITISLRVIALSGIILPFCMN